MSRSPIRVACALLAVLAWAQRAQAVPSAANSHVPAHLVLVGRVGDLADTTDGAFLVVVHDLANNPIFNSNVEVRVLNCPGARLSTQGYEPGTTIRCDTHGAQRKTDIHGEVRVTLVGGGTAEAAPGAGPCAQIFASGILLGIVSLAYLDMDGVGGVGPNDLSLWLTDMGSGETRGRADFDGDGQLTANDLSVLLTVFISGRSQQSAALYCPPASPAR